MCRADDLTKEGMLKGIEQASAFILFLSAGVLNRPYCQMEIREALALKKPITLIHEASRQSRMRVIGNHVWILIGGMILMHIHQE